MPVDPRPGPPDSQPHTNWRSKTLTRQRSIGSFSPPTGISTSASTTPSALEHLIARKRKTGIYLSVLTVGAGNLNDQIAQALAQSGNGTAAHLDSLMEARKVLDDQLASTLFPIADDVKVQIEFNPARVAAYRLIGYETRLLEREDFADDRIDAGEIGSGHTVTALYEIVPTTVGSWPPEPLRYQPEALIDRPVEDPSSTVAGEYGFLKLRYKLPGQPNSHLIETAIRDQAWHGRSLATQREIRFAVTVAAFGLKLRDDPALAALRYADLVDMALPLRGEDRYGYRAEFINLVRAAESLTGTQVSDRR